MDILFFLVVLSLALGLVWLVGFMWAIKAKQFDDLEGNAARILRDD